MGVGKVGDGGRSYKLPVIKYSHEDTIHRMMIIVNSTVLHFLKLLRVHFSIRKDVGVEESNYHGFQHFNKTPDAWPSGQVSAFFSRE